MKKHILQINIHNMLFFIAYALVLVVGIVNSSTIQEYIKFGSNIRLVLIILSFILIIIKMNYIHSIKVKILILLGLLLSIFLLSMYFSKSYIIFNIFVLFILAYKVELKKIVQYFWVIKLPLVLLFLFFSIVGIIENYAFIDVNRGIRYSFGAIYATDFASSIFYIYMAYLYIKNNIKLYDVFFGILLAVFLDIYTDARLSVFLIYMASILFYLVDKKYVKILKKFISRTYMKFIFIIMFLISFITSYLYNASNINWYNFNKMLSNRLYLGNRSLSNYDITLFGQKIEMQGNGWTLKEWDSSLGYNFIDSSYLQWLLIYGIIFATTMLILFTLSYFRAISINDYKLALCLMLIAISGFVEQHILNIVNNPFIFAIVPIIFMDRKEVEFNYEKS